MVKKILKNTILFFMLIALSLKPGNSQAISETKNIRDPFAIPVGLEETLEEGVLSKIPFAIELKGIIIDGNRKYAVINDSIVKENDSWRGITIEKIEKNYISILYDGKRLAIPFTKKEG